MNPVVLLVVAAVVADMLLAVVAVPPPRAVVQPALQIPFTIHQAECPMTMCLSN